VIGLERQRLHRHYHRLVPSPLNASMTVDADLSNGDVEPDQLPKSQAAIEGGRYISQIGSRH
jgi:hypothetical protein